MHLLAVQPGAIDDGPRAVDLDQSPADIVFLSAADTEIAALSLAHQQLGDDAPGLRAANLLQLGHAMSVDLYVERTLSHARIVIARLLGGQGYWPYGVEELARLAREKGLLLALLPGDHRPDEALMHASTLGEAEYRTLWRYFTEGGVENMVRALAFARHLTGRGPAPEQAQTIPPAGLYWPGLDRPSLEDVMARWTPGQPAAAITFYRALVLSGQTGVIDALIEALGSANLNAIPVFAQSFKDETAAAMAAVPTSTDSIGVYAETFNDVSPADGKATAFSKEDVSPGVSALVSGEASAR